MFFYLLLILYVFNNCACSDHQNIYQREELVISNVTSEEYPEIPINVTKWTSLSAGPVSYNAGLMKSGIAVLLVSSNNKNESNYIIKSTQIDLKAEPKDVMLLHHRFNGESQIYLIVAIKNKAKILWYKLDDHIEDLNTFWTWNLTQNINHIKVLKIRNTHRLMIVNEHEPIGKIYRFQLNGTQPNYWYDQTLELNAIFRSCAFTSYKFDSFISFPQKAHLIVYKLNNNNNRFAIYANYSSVNIKSVVSFEIGFKSFIAFDGEEAGIMQFTNNGLERALINNPVLIGINYLLPIPIETYRNDYILLMQREADYQSHKAHIIDVLTYNGAIFEEHEDIPCNYYGDQTNDLSCLVNDPHPTVFGASYIAIQEQLAVLVPGTNTLFSMHFDLVELANPMEERMEKFATTKKILQEIMDSEKEEMEEGFKNNEVDAQLFAQSRTAEAKASNRVSNIRNLQQASPETIIELQEKLNAVKTNMDSLSEKLKTLQDFENQDHFDKIIFNGLVNIKGNYSTKNVVAETIKGEPANILLEDIVMTNNLKPISGKKTFTDIVVEDLVVEDINNFMAADIVYKNEEPLRLQGDITFSGPVSAEDVNVQSGRVNDVLLKEEIVDTRVNNDGELAFDDIKIENSFNTAKMNDNSLKTSEEMMHSESVLHNLDTVFLPNNLTVDNINGENFTAFLQQLCLNNLDCYIPGNVKINGDIEVTSTAFTILLNNLQFPEDFFLKNVEHSNITGHKTFTGSVRASEIRTRGTVNGINTDEIITLSTDQFIPGKVVFENLDVNVALDVAGQILGEDVNKFLPNPTIIDANEIKSNVNFKNIVIEGSVIVSDNLNDNHFSSMLNDLIYKDEETVTITALKHFPASFSVRNDFSIESNSVNDIPIDAILSKNTDQTFNMENLNGNVHFENLFVGGLYGNVNVTKLDQDCVKLTGEQFISSSLIFKDLEVNDLIIEEKLNDLTAEEYLFTSGSREINNFLEFGKIVVGDVLVEGNLNGSIEDFNINAISERMLSRTKDQNVTAKYVINHSEIEELNITNLNDFKKEDLFEEELIMEKFKEKLQNGKIKIRNLYVNGSIQLAQINSKSMHEIQPKTSFENLPKELIFEDNVFFENVEITKLSGINFEEFIERLVFKEETEVIFRGHKNFLNGVTVEKLIETKEVNSIELDNILKKDGLQEISAPLVIYGDVTFDSEVEVEEINNFPLETIAESFSVENGSSILKGDVMFERIANINELEIQGFSNNKPTQEFLSNLVYTNGNYSFSNDFTFEEAIDVEGNILVTETFNDVNLSSALPNIVLITKDAEIQQLVNFTETVKIQTVLKIEFDLKTKYLHGFDTDVWKNNAVFINKGLLSGAYDFENVVIHDSLTTNFLNNIDMDSLVPLKSNQSINFLQFDDVTFLNNVSVGGLVNGYDLMEEVPNTVVKNLDQVISSDIIFNNNVLVRQNLNATRLNNLEANKIVTTNTDQILTADYKFQTKVTVDGNIILTGTVNGINLTNWLDSKLKLFSTDEQNIYNDWNIDGALIFQDNIIGTGSINGLSLPQIFHEIEDRRNYVAHLEGELIRDYNTICSDMNYLYESARSQLYEFQYFRKMQVLDFPNLIEDVHYLEVNNNYYLLAQEVNSCSAHLLVFNQTQFYPVKQIEMGRVAQIIPVHDNKFTYFVTRSSKSDCPIEGTNIWKFENNDIKLFYKIENQLLLQESLIPSTFYGLNEEGVVEFSINSYIETSITKFRKWNIRDANLTFVPRGLKTGLAVTNGYKIFRLIRTKSNVIETPNSNSEVILTGNYTEEYNHYLPQQQEGKMTILNVKSEQSTKSLLAVIDHEETSVEGELSYITIYDNIFTGKMFHKFLANNASSLISLDFDNGETLLVFMENKDTLQVYEYKGIKGFQHRTSATIKGSKLFLMTLPLNPYTNNRKVLGLINENRLTLIEAVMAGSKIRNDLSCSIN